MRLGRNDAVASENVNNPDLRRARNMDARSVRFLIRRSRCRTKALRASSHHSLARYDSAWHSGSTSRLQTSNMRSNQHCRVGHASIRPCAHHRSSRSLSRHVDRLAKIDRDAGSNNPISYGSTRFEKPESKSAGRIGVQRFLNEMSFES